MNKLWKDFQAFALRGNVIDLAVAVVIGVAFNAVVTSLVNDIVMPIIAAVVGEPNFDDLTATIGDTAIFYGRFITAVVNFLLIAATLFVIVRSYEQLQKRTRRRQGEPEAPDKSDEALLLAEIRDLLRDGAGPGTRSGPAVPAGPAGPIS